MKLVVLSALLIAVATAASAQTTTRQTAPTMGGWGSGYQPSTIGTDRASTYRPTPPREFGGSFTTPGDGLRNNPSYGTTPRRPLR